MPELAAAQKDAGNDLRASRQRIAAWLVQAMESDIHGQYPLIAARWLGQTEEVFWPEGYRPPAAPQPG